MRLVGFGFSIFSFFCLSTNSIAADFLELKHSKRAAYYAVVKPNEPCHFKLDGEITRGDLEKIKRMITQLPERYSLDLVCLNSPGGNFAEAIKIGSYFRKEKISTRLTKGAVCESACAIIFMSGSFHAFESGPAPWRVMHPQAKLGFHAPALVVPQGDYSAESVEQAYFVALKGISDTISKIILGEHVSEGIGEEGNKLSMPVSLLGKMLATPSDDMTYVDTVDKVGRWKITLGPRVVPPKLTATALANACVNHIEWAADRTANKKAAKMTIEPVASMYRGQPLLSQKFDLIVDDFTGAGCEFSNLNEWATAPEAITVKINGGTIVPFSGQDYFPASTPLSSLTVR